MFSGPLSEFGKQLTKGGCFRQICEEKIWQSKAIGEKQVFPAFCSFPSLLLFGQKKVGEKNVLTNGVNEHPNAETDRVDPFVD